MSIELILKSKTKVNKEIKVSTTQEILSKVEKNKSLTGKKVTLANKVVDSFQDKLNNSHINKYAVILNFEDLKVIKSTTVNLDEPIISINKYKAKSSLYTFEVCDGTVHYGLVKVYATNYFAADKALKKYLRLVSKATNKLMQYRDKNTVEWKEGYLYE